MHHLSAPSPTAVLVAHGTRSSAGAQVTVQIADAVRAARPNLTVELAHLDVQTPTLEDVLGRVAPGAVLIPMLLARGYHVLSDIPAVAARHPQTRVADPLGPSPLIVEALADRLLAVEDAPPARTLLAAVPSSRPSAAADLRTAADLLGRRLGRPVQPLAAGRGFADALGGDAQLSIAPYLLAPGTFLDQIRAAAPSAQLGGPIGPHPALVRLILDRYDSAVDRTAEQTAR